MFGSIFTGLSGMNAFSNALRQISNNITNVNSNGFKESTLSFSGLFGQGGATAGVTLDKPRLDFTAGELRQTNQTLDLAIDGAGMLVLLKDADQFFTRTGSFEVNKEGDIVLAGTDYKLTVLDPASGRPTAVSITPFRTNPPQATTSVSFADNLSSSATSFNLADIKLFNAAGQSDTWQASFARAETDPAGEFKVTVKNSTGVELGTQTLKFINGIVDPASSRLTFADTSAGRSAIFDFSQNVTSFSSGTASSLRVDKVDGFGPGDETSVAVNTDGNVEITYSNGQKKQLGAVTLALFQDPQSLEQRDGKVFVQRGDAGRSYLTSASERVGRVVSSELEASNVDLSKQFGDLILAQRGFQASSQVVSISNDMIQQLFGMRGQG